MSKELALDGIRSQTVSPSASTPSNSIGGHSIGGNSRGHNSRWHNSRWHNSRGHSNGIRQMDKKTLQQLYFSFVHGFHGADGTLNSEMPENSRCGARRYTKHQYKLEYTQLLYSMQGWGIPCHFPSVLSEDFAHMLGEIKTLPTGPPQ